MTDDKKQHIYPKVYRKASQADGTSKDHKQQVENCSRHSVFRLG